MGPNISNFVVPGKASVVFDGQFGSTGKGLAAAWVGECNKIDWCVTNASANAGHTTVFDDGRAPIVSFHIPSSFHEARMHGWPCIYIDGGAIVDVDILNREIEELNIPHAQIFVSPSASIILPEDTDDEKRAGSSATKIGSTQKGVGTAAARKVIRKGPNLGKYLDRTGKKVGFQCKPVSLNQKMLENQSVLVEVPQGFSLSVNASGFYPYVTNRDCTPQQGLSDAGIHPRFFHKSMAVLRTFPIRVGNIFNEAGLQIGYSGGCYPDQRELTWEEVGQPPEVTTVTKRVRRVFNFSADQYAHMMQHCLPDIVFLNFCNYLKNRTKVEEIVADMMRVENALGKRPLKYYGYSPLSSGISEYVR